MISRHLLIGLSAMSALVLVGCSQPEEAAPAPVQETTMAPISSPPPPPRTSRRATTRAVAPAPAAAPIPVIEGRYNGALVRAKNTPHSCPVQQVRAHAHHGKVTLTIGTRPGMTANLDSNARATLHAAHQDASVKVESRRVTGTVKLDNCRYTITLPKAR